jgi:hypothetical protein
MKKNGSYRLTDILQHTVTGDLVDKPQQIGRGGFAVGLQGEDKCAVFGEEGGSSGRGSSGIHLRAG